MPDTIFHESFGDVTRPLLAKIRKYNVSPADFYELEREYGSDLDAISNAISTYTFQSMYSAFEWYNRKPL